MTQAKLKTALQLQHSYFFQDRLQSIQNMLRELAFLFILIVYFEWEALKCSKLSHGFRLARNLEGSVVFIAVWMRA